MKGWRKPISHLPFLLFSIFNRISIAASIAADDRSSDAGILAIEHADFDGFEHLALITGGEIASTFDNPESVKLGHCKLIEEIMIGEDKLIHFSGVEMGQACTILLRGASFHVCLMRLKDLYMMSCVYSPKLLSIVEFTWRRVA
uniref:Uncharacterized protein n=1 Tax=Nelumbo nucifera TaxID=4432 RepID=A0A822ZV30_NELNU|nr:TPA_asm: hypothetical protein HUJ06_016663 [Nelumbo nucifera]